MTNFVPGRRGIVAVRADASDPKALTAELMKAWTEFKAENNAQIDALKRGQEDVVRTDKVERINSAVGDLQKAIDDVNIKIAAASVGAGQKPVKDRDYSKAFASYGRTGAVQAALDKGAAPEGGYLAPVEWDRTITDRLILLSPMRQIAAIQQISTTGYTKLFNSRGMGSGWVGETALRPETAAPTFGQLAYATGEIYANPSATQQVLDDAQIDLEQFIASNVEDEFAYQEGLAFIAGNGTNKPNGLLTYATGAANAAAHPWGAIAVTTAASATVIAGDDLLSLMYALPTTYTGNARFLMNRATQGSLRKLKDTQGRYLWEPSVQAGQPATLFGFAITEMAAMPAVATGAIPVAFGDFRQGYLIIDRVGVRVLRDPYTNKPYVMFYTTKRVGGGLLNPDVIKVLKMA